MSRMIFKVGDWEGTVLDAMKLSPKMSEGGMHKRIRRFHAGDITAEDVFKCKSDGYNNRGNPDATWEGLDTEKRDERAAMAKIPRPTKFDINLGEPLKHLIDVETDTVSTF